MEQLLQEQINLLISGDPSVNITSTTNYPFEVKTNGSACAPEVVLSGTIQVKPLETLTLASDPSTENQTICAGSGTNTLDPIIYNLVKVLIQQLLALLQIYLVLE